MKMTPLEIQQQQFKVRMRGFDVREVDHFLERVADSMADLREENKQLHEDMRRLKMELQGYKEREETFKRAMFNSQTVLEQMKDNARKSADIIIADAETKAEKILNRAHSRLSQLHEDIAELKRQRVQIEVQLRSVIEAHSKLLDIGKEGADALDAEDNKIQYLTSSK
jgi:cell division initiation protein